MKRLFLFLMSIMMCFFMCSCKSADMVAQGAEEKTDKIGWGLKKVENSQPQVPESWKEILIKYDGYYLGDTNEKVMYLTFDEGYENGYTAKILDVLKKTNTPAAFFVTGPYVDKEQELIKRMVEEGHVVGNHTVNHPSMPELSEAEITEELTELNEKYKAISNEDMKFMRPPRGEFSEKSLAVTQKNGYKSIFWSIAYADWKTDSQKGADYATEQVTKQFHNGAVILLHAVSEDNANALEQIINIAKQQGYTFKSLEDL